MCYSQPRYKGEIKFLLYGRDTRKYNSVDKWFEEMGNGETKYKLVECSRIGFKGNYVTLKSSDELTKEYKKELLDGRTKRSTFYISSVQPVFDYINESFTTLPTTYMLNERDKKRLLTMLKANAFRKSVELSFPTKKVSDKIVIDYSQDVNPLHYITDAFTQTAGAVYALKQRYPEIEKLMPNIYKNGFNGNARKFYKKNKNIQDAMGLLSATMKKTLVSKELATLFIKADMTLLRKLTYLNPRAKQNAGLLLMSPPTTNPHKPDLLTI